MDPVISSDASNEAILLATDQVAEGIILLDAQQRVRWLNRHAERLCGWQRRHAIGKSLEALLPASVAPYFSRRHGRQRTRLDALLRYRGDIPLHRTDSNHVWITLRMQALATTGLRAFYLTDVTVQRNLEQRVQLLSVGFDEAQTAIVISDDNGIILHVNRGFRRLLGYADQHILEQPIGLLLDGDSHLLHSDHMLQRLRNGHSVRQEVHITTADQRLLWCELNAHPVHDPEHRIRQLVMVLTDISESRIHTVLLNRLLEAMARETATSDVMALLCKEVEHIAPGIIAAVMRIDAQGQLHPLAAPSLPEELRQALTGLPAGPNAGACGSAVWSGKTVTCNDIAHDSQWESLRIHALDHHIVACCSTPVHGKDGQILGTFAFYYKKQRQPDPFQMRLVDTCVHLCSLAMERELARQRIHHLAYHDQLTGLPNRSQLMAQARLALAAATYAGESLSVLSVDIERFRQTNELLGAQAGDTLLRAIALRLQSALEPGDIAGRLGGDVFVLIINQCDSIKARTIADRLLELLATAITIDMTVLRPRARIGISVFPDNARTVPLLLQYADSARKQAHQDGAASARFYDEQFDTQAQERRQLELFFRQALNERTISVHYQPQVDLHTGYLYGLEALARWTHPQLGDISPSRFVPLAEETGLIHELGLYVLEQTCIAIQQWKTENLHVGATAINLSPTDFRDPSLLEHVLSCLHAHDLEPADLCIEITEAILLDRHPDTLRTLRQFSDAGIHLALDDFGTGYSSFGYLRELPIHEIKLDQSYINSFENDPVSAALTQAVIQIGKQLRLSIIAEGINSAEQAEKLRSLGFNAGQGFLYASAMPADQLTTWIHHHNRPT